MRSCAMLLALAGALFAFPALAQTNHERHHDVYQNWVNQQDKGCCNDQDCGELAEQDERPIPGGIEVRIEDKWCKVQPFHYLKRGNAPNWSSSHVCVLKYPATASPCERLLCYQPRPGI